MEFPIYDGEVDPLVWLNRCEQFFDTQRTPSTKKVGPASFHLTGDAQRVPMDIQPGAASLNW
jgi:hypothetical protein